MAVLVLLIPEKTVEMVRLVSPFEVLTEHFVDVPVFPSLGPQARVQRQTDEQTVDVPVLHVLEDLWCSRVFLWHCVILHDKFGFLVFSF